MYDTKGVNVALASNGAVASQSSHLGAPSYPASQAIDGDTATYHHTTHTEDIMWLSVVLPYPVTVSKIVIVNRSGWNTSASTAQLRSRHPTKVTLYDSAGFQPLHVKRFHNWPEDTQQYSVENAQYSGKITEDTPGPIEIFNDSDTQHTSMRRVETPTPVLTNTRAHSFPKQFQLTWEASTTHIICLFLETQHTKHHHLPYQLGHIRQTHLHQQLGKLYICIEVVVIMICHQDKGAQASIFTFTKTPIRRGNLPQAEAPLGQR